MPIFEWNSRYSTNIVSIDEEHKSLFSLMNKLFDSLLEGKSNQFLLNIIQELEIYSKKHFANEEFHMKNSGFPYLKEHKQLHNQFANEVKDFKKQLEDGASISVDIIKYLRDWIVQHIMGADMKYVPYLKNSEL